MVKPHTVGSTGWRGNRQDHGRAAFQMGPQAQGLCLLFPDAPYRAEAAADTREPRLHLAVCSVFHWPPPCITSPFCTVATFTHCFGPGRPPPPPSVPPTSSIPSLSRESRKMGQALDLPRIGGHVWLEQASGLLGRGGP